MGLLRKGLIGSAALVAMLLLGEVALRVGAHLLNREPLLTSDPALGWRTRANLDTVRVNADGQPWRVQTDGEGLRKSALTFPVEIIRERRLLILGDSFAFGEGVNVEQRFDALLDLRLEIVNTGTMAYGIEQAYLRAKPLLRKLGFRDIVLLLLYRNDFDDVLRHRHLGRSKPYWERRGDQWQQRPPAMNLSDQLQGLSHLATLATRVAPLRAPQAGNFALAEAVIREVLVQIRRDIPVGATLVLAHHGRWAEPQIPIRYDGALMCDLVDICIDLDGSDRRQPAHFLSDGHWNAAGHAAAGEKIRDAL